MTTNASANTPMRKCAPQRTFMENLNHIRSILNPLEATYGKDKPPLDSKQKRHKVVLNFKCKGKRDKECYAQSCGNFLDKNGNAGPWGKRMLADIDKIAYKCFYDEEDGMDVSAVCPKFKKFSKEDKKTFWLWVFAAMSQTEASCDMGADAPGTNGLADGLFQLEYSQKLRRGSDRDPKYCQTEGTADTKSLKFQSECTISIFRDHNCKAGVLLDSDGYWERLRARSGIKGEISKKIARFPLCNKY